MKTIRKLAIVLAAAALTLTVAGCGTVTMDQAARQTTGNPPVVGAEIAGPGTILQPLPTGALLLSEPADGTAFERNLATCRAFFRTLPSTETVRAESPVAPNLIPTRWLSSKSTVGSRDCTRLVNEYDYARAAALLKSIGHGGSKGPVFVGYLGNSYIAVSGSSYTDGELDDFVGSWAKTIIKANEEYAKLNLSGDVLLASPSTPYDMPIRKASGLELILIGVLKTAAELLYPLAVITTNLAGQ
jgi:hypothetical protein